MTLAPFPPDLQPSCQLFESTFAHPVSEQSLDFSLAPVPGDDVKESACEFDARRCTPTHLEPILPTKVVDARAAEVTARWPIGVNRGKLSLLSANPCGRALTTFARMSLMRARAGAAILWSRLAEL